MSTTDRGTLLVEQSIDLSLYPPNKTPAGAQSFPRLISVSLGGTHAVREVVVLTDWWQKRPKRIVVFDQDGRSLGGGEFETYTANVCGENGDEACEYPARPTAQLRVRCDGGQASAITLFVNGLLDPANQFVILQGVRVYGA